VAFVCSLAVLSGDLRKSVEINFKTIMSCCQKDAECIATTTHGELQQVFFLKHMVRAEVAKLSKRGFRRERRPQPLWTPSYIEHNLYKKCIISQSY